MRKGKRQREEERLGKKIMQGSGAENPGARDSLLRGLAPGDLPSCAWVPAGYPPEMASSLPSAPKVGWQAKLDSLSRERIEK